MFMLKSIQHITYVNQFVDNKNEDEMFDFIKKHRIPQRIKIASHVQKNKDEIRSIIDDINKEIERFNMKMNYNKQTNCIFNKYGFEKQKLRILNLLETLNALIILDQ